MGLQSEMPGIRPIKHEHTPAKGRLSRDLQSEMPVLDPFYVDIDIFSAGLRSLEGVLRRQGLLEHTQLRLVCQQNGFFFLSLFLSAVLNSFHPCQI